jgi:hypothetical protein
MYKRPAITSVIVNKGKDTPYGEAIKMNTTATTFDDDTEIIEIDFFAIKKTEQKK